MAVCLRSSDGGRFVLPPTAASSLGLARDVCEHAAAAAGEHTIQAPFPSAALAYVTSLVTDPAAAATAPLADANLFHALRAAAYLDAPMPLLRGLASRVAAKLSRGAQRALDTESVFLSAEEERGAASERDLGAAAGIAADGPLGDLLADALATQLWVDCADAGMLLALKGGGGPLRVVACRAFASEAWRGADGGGERWRDPPRWLRAGGFRLDLEELRGSCAELDLEVLPARCVASLGKRLGNAPAPAPPACLLVAATVYTIAAANACLVSADLSGVCPAGEPSPALCDALGSALLHGGAPKLERLRLSGTRGALTYVEQLRRGLPRRGHLLHNARPDRLDLSLLNLGDGLAGIAFRLLANAPWPPLRTLSVGGNSLGAAGAEGLARALAALPGRSVVPTADGAQAEGVTEGLPLLGDCLCYGVHDEMKRAVHRNSLCAASTAALCGAIVNSACCAELDFAQLDAARVPVRQLRPSSTLAELALSCAGLVDADLFLVSALLAADGAPHLRLLSLDSNFLGDASVEQLARTLGGGAAAHAQLRRLSLFGNRLHGGGLRALADALEVPSALPRLSSVVLLGNPYTEQSREALQSACSRRAALQGEVDVAW